MKINLNYIILLILTFFIVKPVYQKIFMSI